jgi:hypothetical protein
VTSSFSNRRVKINMRLKMSGLIQFISSRLNSEKIITRRYANHRALTSVTTSAVYPPIFCFYLSPSTPRYKISIWLPLQCLQCISSPLSELQLANSKGSTSRFRSKTPLNIIPGRLRAKPQSSWALMLSNVCQPAPA